MATPTTDKKPAIDIYSLLMLGAALFLIIGTIFMCIELSRYGGLFDGYPWWKISGQQ